MIDINVLLVENNPQNIRLVKTYLEIHPENTYKFNLITSGTLRESRNLLQVNKFDIVLHDVSIPDNHGIQFLDYYIEYFPELPVIVFSDSANLDVAIRAANNGAQDYLVKEKMNEFSLRQTILQAVAHVDYQRQLNIKTSLLTSVLNALPEQIAVIDSSGEIIMVNQPWIQFRNENDGDQKETLIGTNYFEVCASVKGQDRESARRMVEGIKQVLKGERESITMEFPCNSPNQRRWFLASANRLGDGQGCVISQTNITPTKLAQEAIVRRALELDALNQIAKSLGEVENRRRLFARLTERFAKLFNADASVITLVNEENDLITAQAPGYNIPNQLIERIKFSLSVANHSWDLKLLGPLRADGFEQIPDFFIPFARELEVNTVLAVPFFKKDDLSGVIIVMRHEGVFCQEDVDLLQVLAHQTSILIEKANLIDITQEDLVRFALLHRVGKLCIEIKDTDELLAQVTNTIKDSLSLEHLGILLYHPYKKLYMPHTSYDLPEAFKNNQVEVGRGTVGEVIKTGRPIIIGNVDTATNYIQVDPLTKSELVVPLMIGDQVMGAINVESKVKQRFDNSDLQLFTTLANLLASAIARLRQIETERKQHLLAESFQKAVRATNQSLETNQIMDEILNQVRGVLPVDFANIMVFENGDIRVARAFGYDKLNPPVEIENITFKLDNNPVMRSIAREKNTLLVRDTTKYKDWTVFPVTSWVRSFIGSPIQVDGTVYGVLNLDSPEQGFFTKEHAEILEYFSDQVAVAMKNARLYQDLENSYEETLKGWVRNLAMRDDETEEHTQRVTILTVDLARRLGVSEDKLIHYRRGALLHDIGKMGIPDSILHKKGKLTHDEWEIMRKHPVYAYDLLKEIRFLHEALDIPRYHHERYNGSGYPEGLKGKAIPLAARIFAVVDIWDALSHDRPYRKAWSQSKVIGYLKETAGKELDPEIVSVFLQMLNDKRVTTGALHQKDIREFWTSLQHTNSYNESSNYP